MFCSRIMNFFSDKLPWMGLRRRLNRVGQDDAVADVISQSRRSQRLDGQSQLLKTTVSREPDQGILVVLSILGMRAPASMRYSSWKTSCLDSWFLLPCASPSGACHRSCRKWYSLESFVGPCFAHDSFSAASHCTGRRSTTRNSEKKALWLQAR